jgi:hypothetical protein
MKTYRRSEVTAPLLPNFTTRWRWVVNFTPWPLFSRKELRYRLNWRLGRPLSRSGVFWRREHSLPLLGFEPWTVQLVDSRYADWDTRYTRNVYTSSEISTQTATVCATEGSAQGYHHKYTETLFWLNNSSSFGFNGVSSHALSSIVTNSRERSWHSQRG